MKKLIVILTITCLCQKVWANDNTGNKPATPVYRPQPYKQKKKLKLDPKILKQLDPYWFLQDVNTSYLELTGGTLTGQLTGTIANFNTITSNSLTIYSGIATLQTTNNYDGNIRLINSNRSWLVGMLGSPGSSQFNIYDMNASASRMAIDNNGYIGIGTASPSAALDIASNISAALRISRTSSNTYGFEIGGSTFGLYDYTNSSYLWRTHGANFLIAESGGNVGIGINSAETKLHISGEKPFNPTSIGTTIGTMHLNAPTVPHNSTSLTFGGAGTSPSLAQAGIYVQSSSSYGTKMFFATTNDYATGSKNRMIINEDGNVGIGTSTPLTRLQLDKSGQVIGTTTPSGALQVTNLSSGNAVLELGMDPNRLSYIQSRNITNTTPYQLLINPDGGNVGIGINNAETKLHISGEKPFNPTSIGTTIGTMHLNAPTVPHNSTSLTFGGAGTSPSLAQAGIYVQSSSSYGTKMFFATTNDYATGSKNRMIINEDGNVGIGTTTPSSFTKLDVSGPSRTRNVFYVDRATGDLSNYLQIVTRGAAEASNFGNPAGNGVIEISNYNTAGILLGTSNNTPVIFGTGAAERMRIDATGNVSIGATNAQGYKLAVAGNMITEKLVVKKQINWPDYVFHKNYNLQPLAAVEDFIQKNNHLPGIPSAKEVEQRGLDVGDTQALLLKKIEELTLHIIAQEKRIKALEQEQAKKENKSNKKGLR